MRQSRREGPKRHRGSFQNTSKTMSGATVTETGRAAFSLPVFDPAMPSTAAELPRTAAEMAALGLRHDPDKGTRWEGLVGLLPRFRAAPISKPTLSGRHRAAEAPAASSASEKAKRRNARKEARAAAPDWRSKPRGFKPGARGLLAAILSTA
jgi:hypothetical protein